MARYREGRAGEGNLELVFDYVQVNHYGRDVTIGILGLDIGNSSSYSDGRMEYDRDNDYEYCGFARNFLSPSYKPRRRRKSQDAPPVVPSTAVLSTEMHDKRVSKLLEEEEKSKEKAERKRLKRLRQREKKRLAKLEKEKKVPNKNVEATCRAGVNGEGTTSKDSDSSDGSNSSDEDSSEDEESDRESISGNSEELDLNSSFVSKAAVIAKRQLEQMPKSEKRSEKRSSPAPPPLPTQLHTTTPAGQPKERPNAGYNEKTSDSPSPEDILKISTDLAVTGNNFASAGHFAMAVKYFTDAIKYNPKEYKLFGNRSFCFEKMQDYERALTDAELSLNMCPGWVKGLYRKGRALAGLQRYDEAAQAFREVLHLDSSCVDAAQELMRVQITQLMEFGFSREQSSNALIIHGTVQKSLEALSKISGVPVLKNGSYSSNSTVPVQTASANSTLPTRTQSANSTLPARTQSGNSTIPARTASASRISTAASPLPPRFQAQAAKTQPTQAQNSPKTQTPAKPTPRQPTSFTKTKPDKPAAKPELFPIWVGNLVQTVSESMLQDLFSSVGEVHSVKILKFKRCAFVNFTNQQLCDAAIQKFHGHELHEVRITVRYPDRIPNHLGISKSALAAVDPPEVANANSVRECFFWRNLGCSRRPACPFRHILEHKGIDRRKISGE